MAGNRSMWSGTMGIGMINIPIALYSMDSGNGIKFRMLHVKDGGEVGYQNYCKKDGAVIPREEIIKGIEVAPGQFVTFSKAELDALKLPSDKMVKIEHFVDTRDVDPALFTASYIIGLPSKNKNTDAYALMYRALLARGAGGIGKITMRGREYPAFVWAHKEGGMILSTLAHADEIILPKDVSSLQGIPEPKADALNLAIGIVDSLTVKNLDLHQYPDGVRAKILQLVEAKKSGTTITVEAGQSVVAATEGDQLMDALKATLSQFQKGVESTVAVAEQTVVAPPSESKVKSSGKRARKAEIGA